MAILKIKSVFLKKVEVGYKGQLILKFYGQHRTYYCLHIPRDVVLLDKSQCSGHLSPEYSSVSLTLTSHARLVDAFICILESGESGNNENLTEIHRIPLIFERSSPLPLTWHAVVLPLLHAAKGSGQQLIDVSHCVKEITDNELELLDHPAEYDEFYNSLCALVGHFILSAAPSLKETEPYRTAIHTVLKFIASRFTHHNDEVFWLKQFVSLLQCVGRSSGLKKEDVTMVASRLQAATLPPHVRATVGPKKADDEATSTAKVISGTAASSPNKENVPVLSYTKPPGIGGVSVTESPKSNVRYPRLRETKISFSEDALGFVNVLELGRLAVQKCTFLPSFRHYALLYVHMLDDRPVESILIDYQTACSISQTVIHELELALTVLDLPMRQPLNIRSFEMLFQVACGSLLCGFCMCSVKHANSSKLSTNQLEQLEQVLLPIVENVVSIFNRVLKLLSDGGCNIPAWNLRAHGCWSTMNCWKLLNFRPQDTDSSLALLLVNFLEQIFCLVSAVVSEDLTSTSTTSKFVLGVNDCPSSFERLLFATSPCVAVTLLFDIVNWAFNKALKLHSVSSVVQSSVAQASSAERQSVSRELIPDIDAEPIVGPEKRNRTSTTDTESEPLIGSWLEQVLSSVPAIVENALREKNACGWQKSSVSSCEGGLERSEISLYIKVCCRAMEIVDHWLTTIDIGQRLMDKDSVNKIAKFLSALDSLNSTETPFAEFSSVLLRVTNSAIQRNAIDNYLQIHLLELLKLDIWNSANAWPLFVEPHALSILANVFLTRIERQEQKNSFQKTILSVWTRFLKSLEQHIGTTQQLQDSEVTDVNVEYLQFLLFMFHHLTEEDKTTVFTSVAEILISTISRDKKRVLNKKPSAHLTRVLLIMDYLIANFSEPPEALIEEVRRNISSDRFSRSGFRRCSYGHSELTALFQDEASIEEFYRSSTSESSQVSMRPYFYAIYPKSAPQALPVTDELVAFVMLSWPKYNDLYQSVVELFLVNLCVGCEQQPSTLDICTLRYFLQLCWQLVMNLPPPSRFLTETTKMDAKKSTIAELLQLYRLSVRLQDAGYRQWVKENLLKQQVAEDEAGRLLDLVVAKGNSVPFLCDAVDVLLERLSCSWNAIDLSKDLASQSKPSFLELVLLDLITNHVRLVVGAPDSSWSSQLQKQSTGKLLEALTSLCKRLLALVKCFIIDEACCGSDVASVQVYPNTAVARCALAKLLELGIVCGEQDKDFTVFANAVWSYFHPAARIAVDHWKRDYCGGTFEPLDSQFLQSPEFKAEEYLQDLFSAHLSNALKWRNAMSSSAKHLLITSVTVITSIMNSVPVQYMEPNYATVSNLLAQINLDVTPDAATTSLKGLPSNAENLLTTTVLNRIYDLLINHSFKESCVDERIRLECLKFLETLCDSSQGRAALDTVLVKTNDFCSLLLSGSQVHSTPLYSLHLVKFLGKLFSLLDTSPNDASLDSLCAAIVSLALNQKIFLHWLCKLFTCQLPTTSDFLATTTSDACSFLAAFSSYLNRSSAKSTVASDLASSLLSALLEPAGKLLLLPSPIVSVVEQTKESKLGDRSLPTQKLQNSQFCQLFGVLRRLAAVIEGNGHITLIKATLSWLKMCDNYLREKEVVEKIKLAKGFEHPVVESAICLTQYVSETCCWFLSDTAQMEADTVTDPVQPFSVAEFEGASEADSEYVDDFFGAAEEDSGDESDTDDLHLKLCTFTQSQKEFINQHWYYCYTCGMVDGEGVCTVCAKVCHQGHDLSYSKCGSFFCDCGARQDDRCRALKRRDVELHSSAPATSVAASPPASTASGKLFSRSHLAPRFVSHATSRQPETSSVSAKTSKATTVKTSSSAMKMLFSELKKQSGDTLRLILSIVSNICPAVLDAAELKSQSGSIVHLREALKQLHSVIPASEFCDSIVTPLTAATECTFENVRYQFAGDQGQNIRQLLTAHVLHRQALGFVTSSQKKRRMLIVCHDKGKVTILQLSYLTRQPVGAKHKLSLTRLSSETFPFTILSIADNPSSEGHLAVAGLKECHVVSFSSIGSITLRITLKPPLDAGNFITKIMWLPDSQVELALVTADFVRIYDLSTDSQNAVYHFVAPAGKIRDATVACWENKETGILDRYLILMLSSGQLFFQQLSDAYKMAVHGGPFYVMNAIELNYPSLPDEKGNQYGGGGVSAYFSTKLQLLFASYTSGINIVAPMPEPTDRLTNIQLIDARSSASGAGLVKNGTAVALARWSEAPGCPGLLTCFSHASVVPFVLYVAADKLLIQELKMTSHKSSKLIDIIPVCYGALDCDTVAGVAALSEDGNLRLNVANSEAFSFWKLQAPFRKPMHPLMPIQRSSKKKCIPSKNLHGVDFPVDFFESCQVLNDQVEFGGNDILQVYNPTQIKSRLNGHGQYIACAKAGNFQVEVTNHDNSSVMCGIRVELGKHSIDKSPTSIEVFGRSKSVAVNCGRWYDLPFSREETILSNNRVTLTFGATRDPSGFTHIDSIKVYGKRKDEFGFPDEDDFGSCQDLVTVDDVATIENFSDRELIPSNKAPSAAERLLMSSFETVEKCLSLFEDLHNSNKEQVMELVTSVLPSTVHPAAALKARSLLARLFASVAEYHWHKDKMLLRHCVQKLNEATERAADVFDNLLGLVCDIALCRPQNLVEIWAEILDSKDAETAALEQFFNRLVSVFWTIANCSPKHPDCAPASSVSFQQPELVVRMLVEILNAVCLADPEVVPLASRIYKDLLLSDSYGPACKNALCYVLRPKIKRPKRKPHMTSSTTAALSPVTPGPVPQPEPPAIQPAVSQAAQVIHNIAQQFNLLQDQPLREHQLGALLGAVQAAEAQWAQVAGAEDPNQFHALLAAAAAQEEMPQVIADAPLFDVEADDDTIVELAIALSLQEQQQHGSGIGGSNEPNDSFVSFSAASDVSQQLGSEPIVDIVEESESGQSDDEGSTAATEGSTLRTSPVEERGRDHRSASDSGGSGADIDSVSGRSSIYDEQASQCKAATATSSSSVSMHVTRQPDDKNKLHSLHSVLLLEFTEFIPILATLDGIKAVSFMQVMLALVFDVNTSYQSDRELLQKLLTYVVDCIHFRSEPENLYKRSKPAEVELIFLRFLSILMSKARGKSKHTNEVDAFIARSAATILISRNALPYCFDVLRALLQYWQDRDSEDKLSSSKLLPKKAGVFVDLAPFFLKQYVKEHARDIFEDFPLLITEMMLRIPYQLKKFGEVFGVPSVTFDKPWLTMLCEYVVSDKTAQVRKQARKLLLFICGSKDHYRQVRDLHTLNFELRRIKEACFGTDHEPINSVVPEQRLFYDYASLTEMVESLKVCNDIASSRTSNWKKFCAENAGILQSLLQLTMICAEDSVSSSVLSLLQAASCSKEDSSNLKKREKPSSSSSSVTVK